MEDAAQPAGARSSADDDGALPRLSPRTWLWVGSGLAAAVLAVGAYAMLAAKSETVRFQDVGYLVESPQLTTAEFDVFFYDEGVASCTVRALNTAYAEVGVTTVDVDSADGDRQRVGVEIATTEEAVTATVQGCTFAPADAG
ncbi:DUF4307 domain-containing protein [Demequina salsinemoris]|uniref:DUF4307 domain-containing protein n=1 Tax=Demequina salsinemoris TaxID=577470 RepID=UPI000782ADA0|nr:DUF4307 domain-containing protein [Demequina salsinemoris]